MGQKTVKFKSSRHGSLPSEHHFLPLGHEPESCVTTPPHTNLHLTECIKKPEVHIVKPMVFPVVMYGRESWTIKEAEHPRIDAFELWC